MKLVFLVEGRTEQVAIQGFLKRWLDPRLLQPVGVQSVSFQGYADLTRKFADKARMYLDGPRAGDIVGVIAMLDLYGPAYADHLDSVAKRCSFGREQFERQVDHQRFRFHYAVHELEAWLLSQPGIFSRTIAEQFPKNIDRPEEINSREPPAKLLDRIYKSVAGKPYKKVVYGKQLFSKLDPEVAARKCPYLKQLLDDLLELCRSAGLVKQSVP